MIPKLCKICNLFLHYPGYDPDGDVLPTWIEGKCPSEHYSVRFDRLMKDDMLGEYEKRIEIFIYDDVKMSIFIADQLTLIHKNNIYVTTINEIIEGNYRSKEQMLSKLDTFVNFL